MSEIYREAVAPPPGIEPGKAMQQTKPQLCVIAHDVAEKTGAANSVESVSSRTIPPRSKNLGPDRGPTALLTAVVRYMGECGCTPGDLTKMVAVREGRPATVYFVQGVDGGPIKIGHTNKLAYRLDTLQAHSPVRLRLLGTMASTIEMELALHAYFTASRLHGEWFSPTPELLAFIAEFAKPAPTGETTDVGASCCTREPANRSAGACPTNSGTTSGAQTCGLATLAGGGSEEPALLTGEASRPNDVSPGFSRLSSPLVQDGDERRQGQKGSSPGDSDGVERKPGQDRPSPILSSDTFLARSVHIAPDWRARLPAGVTVEMVEQDLAPRAVGR